MDFSAGIELMFTEDGLTPVDRVRAAADSGFPAVEIWDWRLWDVRALGKALQSSGTALHTLCVENWAGKTQLVDPASHELFVSRVRETAAVAIELGAPNLVVLAGDRQAGVDPEVQLLNVADALARAGDAIAEAGLTIVVEVVSRDEEAPNAILGDSATALRAIGLSARANVKFLYDRYHAILNGEGLGEAIDERIGLVGHVQFADVPGRHEPGTGVVDWVEEFAWLEQAGYAGYLGFEGTPIGGSAQVYEVCSALLAEARARNAAAETR